MLIQKYCCSIFAVYAAAAGRRCGYRRCKKIQPPLRPGAAVVIHYCRLSAVCLLSADFVNNTSAADRLHCCGELLSQLHRVTHSKPDSLNNIHRCGAVEQYRQA